MCKNATELQFCWLLNAHNKNKKNSSVLVIYFLKDKVVFESKDHSSCHLGEIKMTDRNIA